MSSKPLPDATTQRLLVEVANLRDDGIPRFRKDWNRFFDRYNEERLLKRRDELRLLWTHRSSRLPKGFTKKDFDEATPTQITQRTKRLYEGWEARSSQPLEEFVCQHWLDLESGGWLVRWSGSERAIRANPRCLPAVLTWACIHHARCLGVCRNNDCPAPYFLLRRTDQKYCSDVCARPAKRAAKLRWWHENRGKRGR